jgi:hypothetical protein
MDRLHNAFADITRRLPGRYDSLREHLQDASVDAVDEFRRLVQNYEYEIMRLERKTRMPWLR